MTIDAKDVKLRPQVAAWEREVPRGAGLPASGDPQQDPPRTSSFSAGRKRADRNRGGHLRRLGGRGR